MKRKIGIIVLIFIYIFTLTACSSGQGDKSKGGAKKEEKQKITIYTDVKDKYTLDIMKYVTEEYKKENTKIDININNAMYKNGLKDELKKDSNIDIVFTNRSNIIDLSKNGFLSDISNFYSKSNISEKFYNIMSSYGMVGDKYYGIGLIPYTLEILYNEDALKKINLPKPTNLKEVQQLLIKINEKNLKIPIALTDDIEPLMAVSSIYASNVISNLQLEKLYNSSIEKYKQFSNMQNYFTELDKLYKNKVISKDTFEKADENIVSKVEGNELPIAIVFSYLNKDIMNSKLQLLSDYSLSDVKINIPVIINGLFSICTNSKNTESANDFLEFVYSDKFQSKLSEQGFITGNKKANAELKGSSKIISEHLAKANNDNILFFYNLPQKINSLLLVEVEKIFKGNYDGKEWDRVVENYSKASEKK